MILKIDLSEIGLLKLLRACGEATINNVREALKLLVGWAIYGGYRLAIYKRK